MCYSMYVAYVSSTSTIRSVNLLLYVTMRLLYVAHIFWGVILQPPCSTFSLQQLNIFCYSIVSKLSPRSFMMYLVACLAC